MNATDSHFDPESRSQFERPGRSGAWRWVALAALAALIFVYVTFVTRPGPLGTQDPAVGQRLDYLQLQPLTGDAAPTSLEDLRGHVALVNYWGTWCGPCVAEFPHLLELTEKFSDQPDFRAYLVSCGGQGSDDNLDPIRAETEKFLQSKQKPDLATYGDENASSRRALSMSLGLNQFGYPTTVVVDRGGTIRGFWVGYNPVGISQMTTLIEELLRNPDSRASSKR